MQSRNFPRSRALSITALFACILAIFSIVSIPIGISQVPVTLQVFAVFLIAMLLGSRLGAFSCLIYLTVGAAGLPVYAGATGGLGVLFGPTGGYLAAFPVAVFFGGLVSERRSTTKRSDLLKLCLAGAAILAITYAIGVVWLSLYLHVSLSEGLLLGAVPFLPFDIAKAVFAIPIAIQLRWSGLKLPIKIAMAERIEKAATDVTGV